MTSAIPTDVSQIKQILLSSGSPVAVLPLWDIVPMPRNPDRRDDETRRRFLLTVNEKNYAVLTVGLNLKNLADRTLAFASACPEIACKLLFHSKQNEFEMLAQEYFEGEPLDQALANGSLETADALNIAYNLVRVLDNTGRPSNLSQRNQELERLREEIVAIPYFSAVDRSFLNEFVFSVIEQELANVPLQTRWTNGDFAARNILISKDQQVRLVDYEFAQATHFPEEDWLRLIRFSPVQEELQKELFKRFGSVPLWLELYFWIRQLVLEHRINTPLQFSSSLPNLVRQIRIIAESSGVAAKHSLFFGGSKSLDVSPTTHAALRLYWGEEGQLSDANSSSAFVECERWRRVRLPLTNHSWQSPSLRLDPATSPAVIEVAGISIRSRGSRKLLWRIRGPALADGVTVTGTSVTLKTTPVLKLFSFGVDPQLKLTPTPVLTSETALECEAWVRVTQQLTAAGSEIAQSKYNERLLEEQRLNLDAVVIDRDALHRRTEALARQLCDEQAEADNYQHKAAVELARAAQETSQLRVELSAITNSRSWKITAPLRSAAKAPKHLLRAHVPTQTLRKLFSLAPRRYRDYIIAARSGLFDRIWYKRTYSEAVSAMDPLWFYLNRGAALGHNPNAYFDGNFYFDMYPDVARAGINPLLHYIRSGANEGRDPSPHFSTLLYLERNPDVRTSGVNPLAHYCKHGRDEARPLGSVYDRWRTLYGGTSTESQLEVEAFVRTHPCRSRLEILVMRDGFEATEVRKSLESIKNQWGTAVNAVLIEGRESAASPSTSEVWPSDISYLKDLERKEIDIALTVLSQSESEWIVMLHPGDIIAPTFYALLIDALKEHPAASIIYYDDEFLNVAQLTHRFKPDWDPEYLASYDYIGRTVAIKRQKFLAQGGLRHPLSRGGIWKWLLSAAPTLSAKQVVHVPFLGLTTSDKKLSSEAHQSILQEVIDESVPLGSGALRSVPPDVVVPDAQLGFRIKRSLPEDLPLVSIIIPTRNRVDLLKTCIDTISACTNYPQREVVVVDNDSDDNETLRYLEELSTRTGHRVLRFPGVFNYSAINNFAVRESKGSVICLLNNDIECIDPEWLSELVAQVLRPGIGCVGAKLLYPNRTVQHAGITLGMHGLCGFWLRGIASNDPGYHYRAVSASTFCAVTAACLVVRREVWDCVSGLDEINLKVAFNDVDFCLKVQALGLRNIVEPHAIAIHHESASRGADAENREKQVRCHTEASVMHARWGELIVADPTYSPNLSLGSEKIRLAFPPRIKARWQDEWYRRSGFTSAGRKEDLNMYGLDSNLVRAREIQHLAHGEHGSLVTPSTNLLKGLTIIILTKNRPDLIVPLLKQLKEQSHSFANQDLQFEILLGDTGSNDPEVLGFYEEFFNPSHWPGTQVRARCIRELRYHFSQNNNQLAALASGQSLLFMNNDIILPEDPRTLLKVFDTLLSDPTIGCLGAVLLYPDGKVQHAGCGFLKDADRRGMPYHLFHHQQQSIESFQATSRCGSVTGAFLAIQTDRFLLVGGFDEQYAAEAQDVALCLAQNRLGHASVCGNFGAIQHLENATRPKGEENLRDRQRLLRQFGSYIEATFL